MQSVKVLYYLAPNGKNVIRDFISSLQLSQQAKVRRILQLIDEYGLTPVIPHLRKLTGTPFWEIRILGKDNIRVIYVTPDSDLILVLHGFIKKTQKTPPKDLQIALTRYQEWQSRH